MILLRNFLFYPLFYLGSFLITAASLASAPFSLGAFRRRVRNWGQWQRWCLKHIIGAKVVIEGKPQDEPALYAIKHESFFEAIDAPNLLDCPSVFAKQELFRIPGWGRAALAYGLIPVARDQGAKMLMGMIRSAKKMSADGRPLVIFPEGTRVPHGERRQLQAGFAGLYKMLGLPVVPVAVESGPVYHRWLKRPGTITYKFCEPIPPGLPRAEVEAKVLEEINSLNV
ncbi:lysophospholipid acyltransferase family protein [Qipengyuania sphaerica]|uniref:lysophospholipid acyltransferase family protein n=1 Tax=Qipengyuania sphaerica TaxID=2867243 RepID=UPI001C88657F|nr:lysophospholipid acyltransferase family protein [Qipengyuania sphaerica]MBX7541698.1 1-acyl-sn-glycerol-3-phosphate acyltransferase [Qipengyuania sphaerica]